MLFLGRGRSWFTRVGLAAALLMAAAGPVRADITILSNSVQTNSDAIGGGGATPVQLGPIELDSNNLLSNSVTNPLDTGLQDAHNGAGDVIGNASGSGIASGETGVNLVTATITGSASSSVAFTATGSGSGLGKANVMLDVVFTPTADTDYTLDASLSGLVQGVDVFSIRRTDQIGNPVVDGNLINSALPGPIVGGTGTFLSGGEYTVHVDIRNLVSGGAANSPESAQTGALFTLVFEDGTVVVPEPATLILLCGAVVFPALSQLRRRRR